MQRPTPSATVLYHSCSAASGVGGRRWKRVPVVRRSFVRLGRRSSRDRGIRGAQGEPKRPSLRISSSIDVSITKELHMRFIPTRFHAPLDYIVGVALIAAPWIFQFSEHTAATVIPIVLGVGLIVYSLFTNYELGVWKVAPMAVHNLIDIAAGSLLAASPWIFGFADDTANVWVPHLVVGLAAVFLGLTTKQQGGYSYRKADTPRTAIG